jgi:5-methylcytosine-specific restriction endonuclease McrA
MASVIEGMVAAAEQVAERAQRETYTSWRETFNKSRAWMRAKYVAKIANRDRHNGELTCDLCGVTKSGGHEMHVDHIRSLSVIWRREGPAAAKAAATSQENLQILCRDDNLAKAIGKARDFRAVVTEGEQNVDVSVA